VTTARSECGARVCVCGVGGWGGEGILWRGGGEGGGGGGTLTALYAVEKVVVLRHEAIEMEVECSLLV